MSQQTLDGGETELQRVTCEVLDGCEQPAVAMLDTLVYGEGNVDEKACEACRDEFLEWADDDRVRALRARERWSPDV